MLANAVSTALERLYATTPVADDRNTVQRIAAVSRVRALADDGPPNGFDDRDARQQAVQRQALTQGVRAVFETSSAGEAAGYSGASDGSGRPAPAVAALDPDPRLEEAILRFIHTMFHTLAEVDGVPVTLAADTGGGTANASAASASVNTGATPSRSALGARIGALAQRYAESIPVEQPLASSAAKTSDPAASASATPNVAGATVPETNVRNVAGTTVPDPALSQAFADVVQALRGNAGNAGGTGDVEMSPNSRGELVNLMQRLAQAMQGAPPVDQGLPTRGGLLSTRA